MKGVSTLLLVPILALGLAPERPRTDADFEHAFERVAESIRPGVVSITSTRRIRLRGLDVPGDPFLGPLFPRLQPFFEGGEPDGERSLREVGMGSGVIVSSDGHVLTNHHVVAGSSELKVRLSDRREFPARVVGKDPRSDLAVIQIDAQDLVPVRFGDSDALRVGQWVAAFGSPFGLDQTMSCGIVSAKGRANLHITDFEDFLQTDAAINPGNSGGPLVDLSGAVVGINTAIVTRSGGYQGVGLAIPAAMARQILERILRDGEVVRGWLGVSIQELTPELGRAFGFGGTGGVLVAEVVPESPAEKAGLVAGDILSAADGRAIESLVRFRGRIADGAPGDAVTLEVWRNGAELEVTVELGTAPDAEGPAAAEARAGAGFGLELGDLAPAQRRELDLPEEARGAVVLSVQPESSAEEAGLQRGDVLLRVERSRVDDARSARELLRSREKQGAALLVLRGRATNWVFLAPAEPGQ